MASRTIWKGFIQFSLVAVPVKAYTATASGGGHLAEPAPQGVPQPHPIQEVVPRARRSPVRPDRDGYEFAEGQYVVVDPDELEKIRSPKEKSLNIEGFIDADAVDATYFSGKTWYLRPTARSREALRAVRKVMSDANRVAFAQCRGQRPPAARDLRPLGGLIAGSMLSYSSEVKGFDEFEKEVVHMEVDPKELQLAKTLTDSLVVRDFDLSVYKDDYTEKLTQLIEAKVAGKQIVEPPAEEPAQVINLMEALQKSLAQAKAKPAAGGKPAKLTAPGTAEKAAGGRSEDVVTPCSSPPTIQSTRATPPSCDATSPPKPPRGSRPRRATDDARRGGSALPIGCRMTRSPASC